ncbi:hypothetical protein KY284_020577 [Solanum tuberosum]|nr:hypothetical protein KY284_020577 [Solanum tuberosum]
MLEAEDVVDLEGSIWCIEKEEMAHANSKSYYSVKVSAANYDTYAVPWNYEKGKAKVEETDISSEVTWSGRIYTSENMNQGSSSKSKPPVVEFEENDI